jgi:hypothetical protein
MGAAAPLFCGGFSAMSAYRAGRPTGGDRVAVLGLGGLGHLALQVAVAMGHEVLAITNSTEKEKAAREQLPLQSIEVIRFGKANSGAPGEIRTPDLTLRRRSLYPAELRAHLIRITHFEARTRSKPFPSPGQSCAGFGMVESRGLRSTAAVPATPNVAECSI